MSNIKIKAKEGIVTSNKMDKTLVVVVTRRVKHPLYGKILTKTKKYHIHDEENAGSLGDRVRFSDTRPFSKTKKWALIEIVEKAAQSV